MDILLDLPNLQIFLQNYPSMPRVVSIGVHVKDLSTKTDRTGSQSVELCAGWLVCQVFLTTQFINFVDLERSEVASTNYFHNS